LISIDTIKACGDSTLVSSLAGMTTYAWSNGKTTQNIFVKSTGWYKLTATNPTGCSGIDSVFVVILKAKIRNNDTAICFGSQTTLVADSFPNVNLLWSNGSSLSSINISPNITSLFWFRVSNTIHQCFDTVQITVNPLPKLQAPKTVSSNCSGVVSYTANSTVSGSTFSWIRNTVTNITPLNNTGANSTISETLSNSTPNPISVNYIYNLTSNNCSQLDTVIASIIPSPSLSSTKTPNPIWSGDTFKYKATTATLGATFSWIRMSNANITPAPNALSNNDTIGERLTNNSSAPTIIKYVINLTANGCTKVDTVNLTVNPTPRLTPVPTLQNI
jgi:hypothetical protein